MAVQVVFVAVLFWDQGAKMITDTVENRLSPSTNQCNSLFKPKPVLFANVPSGNTKIIRSKAVLAEGSFYIE